MLQNSDYDPFVREFLKTLDQDCLHNLALTAANNRILPSNVEEAIDVILLHTQDLGKFFSYRRIKSQVLFLYLHKQSVPVNATSSKTQLIVAIQQYWMSRMNSKSAPAESKRKTRDNKSTKENDFGCKTQDAEVQLKHFSQTSVEYHCNQKIITKKAEVRQVGILENHGVLCQGMQMIRSDNFAKVFCEWFYIMINRLQPVCASQPGDTFRESVFFTNSSINIYIIGEVMQERHAEGQTNTYSLLKDILLQTELLFSPNLSDGTQAHKSDHGMIKIFSCGTLHKGESFVGVYEQEFGLVLSPTDRTWKIMYTKVNLKHTGTQTEAPRLPPCDIFQIEQL